jgi:hypothetical protein
MTPKSKKRRRDDDIEPLEGSSSSLCEAHHGIAAYRRRSVATDPHPVSQHDSRAQERGHNDGIRKLRDASGHDTLYTYLINDETLMSRSFVCYGSVAYGHRAALSRKRHQPLVPLSPLACTC